MGKLMCLILIVAVAYGGWEIHSKGKERALGGIFASSQEPSGDSKRTHKSRVTRMGQVGPIDGIDD
jgi:hypothetical protein